MASFIPRSISNATAPDDDALSVGSGKGLTRANSLALFKDSVLWLGEQAQTQFLDSNLEAHTNGNTSDGSTSPGQSQQSFSVPSYNSFEVDLKHTIRFQVIVWSISAPDVKTHRVSMKFRVTLFWNDPPPTWTVEAVEKKRKNVQQYIWAMAGRATAYKKKMSGTPDEMLHIPPISILNADSFDIIGSPEVQLLREDTRLYRWSCMYRAQLHQSHISVKDFPHDEHDLCLKLGIISQRHRGGRWDKRKWKIGLANESDTQGTIRIPYGVLVDDVKIPEFYYDEDLNFELSELNHGSKNQNSRDRDYCLAVKLRVHRDSGYYDKNIMPLLSMLNLVSISILAQDADNDFQRSLLSLNIAFVEVGLRMALDSHLPSVGYQIKMQRILNRFFYSILTIVLESSFLKLLIDHEIASVSFTRRIDLALIFCLLMNQAYLTLIYQSFNRLRQARENASEMTNNW
mmetsp:Transcript_21711/g.37280  ORF Transcript_21711/g.37280 Transcript_21711/m.37280 type:complete len:458 (-) Transcript_21711:1764-3137(-)